MSKNKNHAFRSSQDQNIYRSRISEGIFFTKILLHMSNEKRVNIDPIYQKEDNSVKPL